MKTKIKKYISRKNKYSYKNVNYKRQRSKFYNKMKGGVLSQNILDLLKADEINISDNNINDIDIKEIIKILKLNLDEGNLELKSLNISDNKIGSTGGSIIGSFLKSNTKLQKLNISDNNIIHIN